MGIGGRSRLLQIAFRFLREHADPLKEVYARGQMRIGGRSRLLQVAFRFARSEPGEPASSWRPVVRLADAKRAK
jgi:hypothetical protein